jgi:hypothetical protein
MRRLAEVQTASEQSNGRMDSRNLPNQGRREMLNRRDALLRLIAVPLAARQAAAAGQTPGEVELVVCGWDEVFILAVGEGPMPAHRKVWSWRAADSPGIPADMHPLFRTTDD